MSLKPPVTDKDHLQGSAKAHIELVEYGDYQCPHCGRAYPIVKSIQKKLGAKLKFVFRNFPLQEIHPYAVGAAIATEAAAGQGKYWEMHDILFENQDSLDPEGIVDLAQQIGLNIPHFKKDIENDTLFQKVDADFESGIRSGVNGTPTFFINGAKYNDSWDEETLLAYLEGL